MSSCAYGRRRHLIGEWRLSSRLIRSVLPRSRRLLIVRRPSDAAKLLLNRRFAVKSDPGKGQLQLS